VPQADVDSLPDGRTKPAAKELKLASQIIDSLSSDWDPKRYHDTYTEELKSIIEAKSKGKEIVAEEEAEPEAKVTDLMAALEASLDAARAGGASGKRKKSSPARKKSA
jgi:DNA end-binding protein Ku